MVVDTENQKNKFLSVLYLKKCVALRSNYFKDLEIKLL